MQELAFDARVGDHRLEVQVVEKAQHRPAQQLGHDLDHHLGRRMRSTVRVEVQPPHDAELPEQAKLRQLADRRAEQVFDRVEPHRLGRASDVGPLGILELLGPHGRGDELAERVAARLQLVRPHHESLALTGPHEPSLHARDRSHHGAACVCRPGPVCTVSRPSLNVTTASSPARTRPRRI